MTLRAQKCELDKRLQVLKEPHVDKDLAIVILKRKVTATTKVSVNGSKLIEMDK
jgi:hypothetical protein